MSTEAAAAAAGRGGAGGGSSSSQSSIRILAIRGGSRNKKATLAAFLRIELANGSSQKDRKEDHTLSGSTMLQLQTLRLHILFFFFFYWLCPLLARARPRSREPVQESSQHERGPRCCVLHILSLTLSLTGSVPSAVHRLIDEADHRSQKVFKPRLLKYYPELPRVWALDFGFRAKSSKPCLNPKLSSFGPGRNI